MYYVHVQDTIKTTSTCVQLANKKIITFNDVGGLI